jgi:hypothetical protein
VKNYKYKLETKDNVVGLRKIYSDAGRQNQEVRVDGKEGIWKPTLGIRKKDLKQTKLSAAHYGELIAYLLYSKVGIPVCKVDILKRKIPLLYSKSGKMVEVPGCVSYKELADNEVLVQAINVLAWYKDEHYDEYVSIVDQLGKCKEGDFTISKGNEMNNDNIELIIPAFEAFVKERCDATPEQLGDLRQTIIDMVVADCKFSNPDRNDENYGLAVSKDGTRFYPIFDNEYILGLSEYSEDIEKFSAARLQEHLDKDLTSRMGISSQVSQIGYQSMMTYLFTTYPEETKNAYEKIMQIKEQDLVEIMDECEGLDDIHKEYALRIFKSRNRGFKYVKEEYIDENGNFIPQILPGNKPMEMQKRKSDSHYKKATSNSKSNSTKEEKEHEL